MKVGVVGATGYVGSEVCRWVIQHPKLQLETVVSTSRAGTPLVEVVPALLGATDLVLQSFSAENLASCDVVFLGTPHGVASTLMAELGEVPVVVDCSNDHRHAEGWVFGQPEWNAEQLLGAKRIAAPGCFATALMLAIAPLAAAGVIAGDVNVAAATGSTGSGATAKSATHHPERFVNLKAYKVLSHQHVPEVRTFLSSLSGDEAPAVRFVPWSAPLDRGIFATCFIPVTPGTDAKAIVTDAYADKPLVRLREGTPEVRHVRGTAWLDIAVHQDGDVAVVLAAIDNLGRGAAAQAVQALNTSLGWAQDTGLRILPCTP